MDDQTTMVVIWAIIAAIALVVEMFSLVFVGLYITVGALAAAGAAGLDWPVAVQFGTFSAVGIVLLLLTRPVIIKKLHSDDGRKSNVDTIIDRSAIVTIEIDNDASTGQIRVGTEYWTARSEADGTVIARDTKVKVGHVDGVTAFVTPIDRG